MPRKLELRVGAAADALDRFEAAWNRVQEGRAMRALEILTFESLPLLSRTLSPARWALLGNLKGEGACSIYELAKRLGRDYKNVHTDVTQLTLLGLIEKDGEGRVGVPWDVLRAELRL
jgi:predicted transcriptional regulator